MIAAQANATSILVVTALVTYEAIRRHLNPTPVNGAIVIAVALGAAACNLAAALVLRDSHAGHGHGEDLNMRSAILHMTGDTGASLGVAAIASQRRADLGHLAGAQRHGPGATGLRVGQRRPS